MLFSPISSPYNELRKILLQEGIRGKFFIPFLVSKERGSSKVSLYCNCYEWMNYESMFYSMQSLVAMLDISESTIRRMIASGDFPKGIRISRQCIRWSKESVQQWASAK